MKRFFPKHFYEKIRRTIATDIVQKELYKLLPSLDDQSRKNIRLDIDNWFDGKASELAPVMDFWNGFEGITLGFKLKNILRYLTAQNINWSKQSIDTEKVILHAYLEIYDKWEKPIIAKDLMNFLHKSENKSELNNFIKNVEYHSTKCAKRDDFPIIVIKYGARYELLDGHRRTLKHIIYNRKKIKAYVGTFTDSDNTSVKNYWVSTGFLRNLIHSWNEAYINKNTKLQKNIENLLKYYISNFQSVSVLFDERILNKAINAKILKDRLIKIAE